GGFGELLWLRGGTGLLAGLLSTCTASFVGDFFPYHRRGSMMGAVLSSYFAALILGVPIGAWLAQAAGWRSVFLLSAATAGLILVASLLALPSDSQGRQLAPRGASERYRELLKNRQALAALLVSFLVSGGTLSFLTYIAGHLNQAFALSPVEISSVFLIAGLASALASPLSGWFSDRWTKRAVFLWTNSALVIPLIALPYLDWDIPLFLLFFAIGLCIAFRQTALQTLQTQLAVLELRGSYLALRNTFSQLGISFSVFIAGFLYDGPGYTAVVLWAAALTLLASLLLYRWVEEPDPEGAVREYNESRR
ncbi:MAG TPA: MFS transporter, partial [Acidobacteriota bacterium]|nr:MFS transporter [Acidobacteriota bacterium]